MHILGHSLGPNESESLGMGLKNLHFQQADLMVPLY